MFFCGVFNTLFVLLLPLYAFVCDDDNIIVERCSKTTTTTTTTTTMTKEEEEEDDFAASSSSSSIVFVLRRRRRRHASTPVQLSQRRRRRRRRRRLRWIPTIRRIHLRATTRRREDTRLSEKTSRTRPRRKETRKRRTKEVKMEGALQRVFFKDRKCGNEDHEAPLGRADVQKMEYDAAVRLSPRVFARVAELIV